jgi:hypothetical protein
MATAERKAVYFTDTSGRQWRVRPDRPTMQRISEYLGLDLYKPEDVAKAMNRLAEDTPAGGGESQRRSPLQLSECK